MRCIAIPAHRREPWQTSIRIKIAAWKYIPTRKVPRWLHFLAFVLILGLGSADMRVGVGVSEQLNR